MGYDFPFPPNNGQIFTPIGGPTYIWTGQAWQRYGASTGTGLPDAPTDGKQYGRQLSAWTEITVTGHWDTLVGKPPTFPPTLPIAQAGITNLTSDLAEKEDKSAKGTANGYAPLDGAGLVPSVFLPAYVDEVQEYATVAGFPVVGDVTVVYVALDTNKVYRWGGSTYVEISSSPGNTDDVPEGSVNLYHTTTRAAAAAPVQTVNGQVGTVIITKASVGLSNVDNTSDANKPISTATQTAIDAKLTDAPSDGTVYGRRNAAWIVIPGGGGGGLPEAPATGGQVFARQGSTTSWIRSIEYTADFIPLQTRVSNTETKNTEQDGRLTTNEAGITSHGTRLTAVEAINATQTTDISSKVNRSGDIMTGALAVRAGNPGVGLDVPASGGKTGRLAFLDTAGAYVAWIEGDTPTKVMSFNGASGWTWALSGVSVAWADIAGKPATFPPTLPIAVANITFPVGLISQYWRGDKSWQTLDKATVGLNNVDNTSDLNKPPSTATLDALSLRVLKSGDIMTGPLVVNEDFTIAAGDPAFDPASQEVAIAARSDGQMELWWDHGDQHLQFYPNGVVDFPVVPTVGGVPIGGGGGGGSVAIDGSSVMTGALQINLDGYGHIFLDRDDEATFCAIVGRRGTNGRWWMLLGNNDTESGGNAGSDFRIQRHADDGGYLGTPFIINRASGVVDFETTPTVAGTPIGGGGAVAWADITGKPTTFPPTVPIAQANITNLVTDLGNKQALDATLTALAGLNTTAGLVEQTGTDVFTKRLIGVANTTDIPTRANGDARWQTLDATLTALAGLDATAGIVEQTGSDAFTKRAFGVGASTSVPTRADADARYALLAGATMTGALVFPISGTAAATLVNFGTAGTGIFGAASTLNFSTGGTERFRITSADTIFFNRLQATAGAVGAAAIHFGSSNTGFYGSTDIRATIGGNNKMILDATNLTLTTGLVIPAGTVGSMATRAFTVSTSDPTGGADGDIWFKTA